MATPRYIVKKTSQDFESVLSNPSLAPMGFGLVAGGAALTLAGLLRRGLIGYAVTAIGASLVYYGLTSESGLGGSVGDADLGHATGPSFPRDNQSGVNQPAKDAVEEASMESFPASDAPAKSTRA